MSVAATSLDTGSAAVLTYSITKISLLSGEDQRTPHFCRMNCIHYKYNIRLCYTEEQ